MPQAIKSNTKHHNMNILLTGGAGYIGSHTLIELDKAGHSVVVVDNFYNSQPEAIRRVEKIIGHEVTLIEADIRDREAMDKVFTEHKIDAVINFAGLKAVGESVAKPLTYYETNMNGVFVLVDVMQKHGCKNIIMMNIIGCPEGIATVQKAHPDVDIYMAACDERLNEHKYIIPGLGDAGDRIFGTK